MNQIKSYPRPSKIRYRLERVWLRLWLRKLILYLSLILVFSTFCILIFVYSNDWIKLKDYKNYFKNNIFERPELSVSKLEIKTTNLDLINQINAILKLSFPINSIKLDINHIQKIINQIDSVESSNVRIKDSGVLLVEVIERKPVAVYRENDDLALIDFKGHKIKVITTEGDMVQIVTTYNDLTKTFNIQDPSLARASLRWPATQLTARCPRGSTCPLSTAGPAVRA